MASLEHVVKRWAGGALLVVGLVAGTAVAAGMLLPRDHLLTRRLILSRAPDAVWRAMTDSVHIVTWRTDLAALERLPDAAGRARWRERGADGSECLVTVLEETAPVYRRIRRSSADGNTVAEWEMSIERHPSGVLLTVTEHGSINRRWERFASQFASGHAGALEQWLELLAAYFDEPARIS